MAMKLASLAVLLAATCILGLLPAASCQGPINQVNGNLFVDAIIGGLQSAFGSKLDSIDLPERTVGWHQMIGLVNLTGKASLYNGFLHGFKSIHRTDDAHIRHLSATKTSIVVKLAAAPLGVSYTAKVSMFGIGPRLLVRSKISFIELDMTLLFDSEAREIKVLEVDVSNMGKPDLTYDSPLFLSDKIGNLFIKATLRTIQPAIRYAVRYSVRRMLTDAVRKIPMPEPPKRP